MDDDDGDSRWDDIFDEFNDSWDDDHQQANDEIIKKKKEEAKKWRKFRQGIEEAERKQIVDNLEGMFYGFAGIRGDKGSFPEEFNWDPTPIVDERRSNEPSGRLTYLPRSFSFFQPKQHTAQTSTPIWSFEAEDTKRRQQLIPWRASNQQGKKKNTKKKKEQKEEADQPNLIPEDEEVNADRLNKFEVINPLFQPSSSTTTTSKKKKKRKRITVPKGRTGDYNRLRAFAPNKDLFPTEKKEFEISEDMDDIIGNDAIFQFGLMGDGHSNINPSNASIDGLTCVFQNIDMNDDDSDIGLDNLGQDLRNKDRKILPLEEDLFEEKKTKKPTKKSAGKTAFDVVKDASKFPFQILKLGSQEPKSDFVPRGEPLKAPVFWAQPNPQKPPSPQKPLTVKCYYHYAQHFTVSLQSRSISPFALHKMLQLN